MLPQPIKLLKMKLRAKRNSLRSLRLLLWQIFVQHVSKLKPKKLRPPLWQISVRHRHTASSGPWIATGDGTTGTFHKSHSKRHACTQSSAETEADCQSIRNTGSTLQRGPKKRGMSFQPFSADKAWQLESLRIEVLSGQPCQSTVMACGFAFIDFCTSSEKSERYLRFGH